VSNASAIFKRCVRSIRDGALIEREQERDKEFHFQSWFGRRLDELGLNYDVPGRNAYPDFRLVQHAEGYELKGLAYKDSRQRAESRFRGGKRHAARRLLKIEIARWLMLRCDFASKGCLACLARPSKTVTGASARHSSV